MYDFSTLIVPSSKKTFFYTAHLDLPSPYAGVSVDPVTHKQGLCAYVLLGKTFLTLIGQKLGTEIKKNAELRSNFAVFSY
jgi:hypothetical protein